MRTFSALAVAAVLAFASACATKTVSLPPVGPPHFPEYVQPGVPTVLARSPAVVAQHERAWRFLQAGDLHAAERENAVAMKAQPGFYPGEATSAYILLARKESRAALTQFTRLVNAHPDYVPALVGKGLAHVVLNQNAEAVIAFRAAVKVDPSLTDIARRVEVLTLRGLQEELTAARQAERNGQPDAAMRAYRNAIAASPDSAFLYRELAAIEFQQGEMTTAVEHLRRAHALDPSDASTLVLLGDILDQQGDAAAALEAYSNALALERDSAVEAKRRSIRARLDRAALPEQYRAIDSSAQVTRADLAALIGVQLADLVQAAPVRDVGVITDIRGHWAERWIAPVARAGIIEAYPNHTFQPRAIVRRVELAQAVSRLLSLVARRQPAGAQPWAGARGRFTDMTSGHLAYPAASMAVAAGVLEPSPDGAFQPTRAITGAEAIAAIERVRMLGGTAAPAGTVDRR